jgi:hypothetical protein
MPGVAALLVIMATLDFSRHEEWTLGDRHYWFGWGFRMLVRAVGFTVAALICLAAWRETKARERAEVGQEAKETRELAGRAFVPGKRPGADP